MASFQYEGYWAFVNAPAQWAIDQFLRTGDSIDTWGVDKRQANHFRPGQLGFVRVGVDRRSKKELEGHPRLAPGIYALCQVISEPFPGSGARDRFWNRDFSKERDWPTVRIQYLRSYLDNPLLTETLREKAPNLSRQLLFGWQGSSFPVSREDFQTVLALLNESDEVFNSSVPAKTPSTLSDLERLERQYADATPEVREAVSRQIERGPIGNAVKRANGYRCQICATIGLDGYSFKKPNGDWYAEAHHVEPVATRRVGTLSSANIICVCPNHHRQLHYGGVDYREEGESFVFGLPTGSIRIPKFKL